MADVKHALRQQGFGGEKIRGKDRHEQDWRKNFHNRAASLLLKPGSVNSCLGTDYTDSDRTPLVGWERVNPAKRDDVIENLWFYK
jgi:hypothetical protein